MNYFRLRLFFPQFSSCCDICSQFWEKKIPSGLFTWKHFYSVPASEFKTCSYLAWMNGWLWTNLSLCLSSYKELLIHLLEKDHVASFVVSSYWWIIQCMDAWSVEKVYYNARGISFTTRSLVLTTVLSEGKLKVLAWSFPRGGSIEKYFL